MELDENEAKGVMGKEMDRRESKDQEGECRANPLLYLRVSDLVSSCLYVH